MTSNPNFPGRRIVIEVVATVVFAIAVLRTYLVIVVDNMRSQ